MTQAEKDAVGLRMQSWDHAKEMALRLANRINLLCVNAAKEGKDLCVSATLDCQESRPTINGHYQKYELRYRFIGRDEDTPADFIRYRTEPLVQNSGQP